MQANENELCCMETAGGWLSRSSSDIGCSPGSACPPVSEHRYMGTDKSEKALKHQIYRG